MNNKKKNILQIFNNFFKYKEQEEYDFTVPEVANEKEATNISYDNQVKSSNDKTQNVFTSLNENLSYIKVRYNKVYDKGGNNL